MLQRGRTHDDSASIDPTPMKRARQDTVIIQGNNSSTGATKPNIIITTESVSSSSSSSSVVPLSDARIKQKANLIAMRFKKAMRRNDSTTMKVCLESGYQPTVQEWLQIIGKMHVSTALNCVELARTLKTPCISAAVRRQHKKLFKIKKSHFKK